jgi:hypothetical protein
MHTAEYLTQAMEIEAEIDERISRGEAGSYLDYLHHKANAYRARAAEAKEEDEAWTSQP